MPTDTVCTLCFAYDEVLIARDYGDINYVTRKLIEEYRKWGLDVNVNESKNTCVGGERRNLTLENGQDIKCCAKYKYEVCSKIRGLRS